MRDGDPVACAGPQRLEAVACEIRRVFVRKAARGDGVARTLLAALLDAARELGYERARLDTGDKLTEARGLFLAFGFKDIDDYTTIRTPPTGWSCCSDDRTRRSCFRVRPPLTVDHAVGSITVRRPQRQWARQGGSVIEVGHPAPEFALPSDTGETVALSSLRGRPVVLYFYPKDDTPGCTAQACGIRDAWSEFEKAGAVVLGVSPDGEASHASFKKKYDLPFTLLADAGHELADAYDVWVEKTFAGKTYMGVERSTFVIDGDGNIAKVFRRVKPAEHTDQVLAALS